MTDDQEKLLAGFEDKFHELLAKYNEQEREIERLNDDLEIKNKELQLAKQEISKLEAKYDFLLIARKISEDKAEMKHAKERLSKLVREVDRCIALLNE
ncbi:hypothetical protein M2459_002419 [Parabacteroides sp. PF5-5]|uniref:hypothetical protein n=1 Tax=unclassified Parabacteroides TaxID=2649774 RepID=UPI002476B946|nr:MULTISPECIES: hypothetical protein [unclassified Parabacteroides]MDH6305319.1 hypothetical protein [Parabacteroides sp. PH5-39]MDH6316672.1 hypothetical protein [Parabacteroides sp. PF5-13]MDH6320148.1 hypothetical protein [Parabacteroides sp. PH5-13]MDH6323909.1 hypothetical protein [Parabacteroides sp. PH5-8]MDH6327825.1 hypothetical protein [Parabacteroides sp. PH5-41]